MISSGSVPKEDSKSATDCLKLLTRVASSFSFFGWDTKYLAPFAVSSTWPILSPLIALTKKSLKEPLSVPSANTPCNK